MKARISYIGSKQKNSCMFEFPALQLPTNLVQPMHSPLALTEHVSLNLAGTFLLDPVSGHKAEKLCGYGL